MLYLNGSGRRISGYTDENDHDRWTGKHHYAALFSTVPSTVPMDVEDSFFRGETDQPVDSLRLVIYTSWKTRGVPRDSCSHEIYRGLRSPLFRKGCKRRAAAARRRSSSMIKFLMTFFISRIHFVNAKFDIHRYYLSSVDSRKQKLKL